MNYRHRLGNFLRDYKGTLLFLGLMLVFRASYADWMLVPTGSMNPTILEGDRILVDKHVYGWRIPFTTVRLSSGADPQRGDIVVFDSPKDGTSLVKRVIGLPGDTVAMRDEQLYINGRALEYAEAEDRDQLLSQARREGPLFYSEQLGEFEHSVMFLSKRKAMRNFDAIRIPAGQYLMLGDNRDNSEDSRFIGLVPRDSIVGKATRVVASLNPENFYLPRGDRFLSPLL